MVETTPLTPLTPCDTQSFAGSGISRIGLKKGMAVRPAPVPAESATSGDAEPGVRSGSESAQASGSPSQGPVHPGQATYSAGTGSFETPDERSNPLGGFRALLRLHARQKNAEGQAFGPLGIRLLQIHSSRHQV